MSACGPCLNESKLWEPLTAVEYNVSWDIIRGKERLGRQWGKSTVLVSDIIGPFKINLPSSQGDVLTTVRFFCAANLKATIHRHYGSPEPELLVRVLRQSTARGENDQDSDRSRWPPPQGDTVSFILTSSCDKAEMLDWPLSSMRHLTLRLQLFRRRAVSESDLALSLNEARLAGCALCDVVLEADGKEFRAHKAVLCARSPVFKAMLTSDFKEKKTGCVAMTDVSEEAMEKFLHFLYTGCVADWGLCEFELLYLAEKYKVKRLHALCEMRLWGLEDGVRALSLLLEAPKWPVVREEVRSRLAALVAANWSTVKDTKTWQQAKAEVREPTWASIVHAFATISEESHFQPST